MGRPAAVMQQQEQALDVDAAIEAACCSLQAEVVRHTLAVEEGKMACLGRKTVLMHCTHWGAEMVGLDLDDCSEEA